MRFRVHETDNVYTWTLEGSPPSYPVLAVGPSGFGSEKAARSSIAEARKAMRGYKFAKVVVEGEDADR